MQTISQCSPPSKTRYKNGPGKQIMSPLEAYLMTIDQLMDVLQDTTASAGTIAVVRAEIRRRTEHQPIFEELQHMLNVCVVLIEREAMSKAFPRRCLT